MPKINSMQFSLNGGEFSPVMSARVDTEKRRTAVELMQNMVVVPQGPSTRRPGTKFVSTVELEAVQSKLIDFVYSDEQAYMIEVGNGSFRIFLPGGTPVYVAAGSFQVLAADLPNNELTFLDEDGNLTEHWYHNDQGPFRLTDNGGGFPAGLTALTQDYYIKVPRFISFDEASVSTSTDLITKNSHGLSDEMGPYRWRLPEGALPTPFDTNTDYYISFRDSGGTPIADSTNTFTLSTTKGGNAVNITAAGDIDSADIYTLDPTDTYRRQKCRLSTTAGGAAVDITGASGSTAHTIDETTSDSVQVAVKEPDRSYLSTQLADITDTAHSADILFIGHPDVKPLALKRFGHTNWWVDAINFIDGPYFPVQVLPIGRAVPVGTTMTPSAVSGNNITLTSSVAMFKRSDVGRLMRLDTSTASVAWSYAQIRERNSATEVVVNILGPDLENMNATEKWRFGSWGNEDFPKVAGWDDQRLYWANHAGQPNAFYGSVPGIYEDMTPSGVDGEPVESDAVAYALAANRVDPIVWIESVREMLVGTADGVWSVTDSTLKGAITPLTVKANVSTRVGASRRVPVVADDLLIYTDASTKRLYGLKWSLEDDAHRPTDLSITAEHLTDAGIDEHKLQDAPNRITWMRDGNGALRGMTYLREQQVIAWHRHVLGGSFSGGDPVVESIAVVPSSDATYDEVWMIVKRTINSATHRYIEVMNPFLGVNDSIEEARYLDCSVDTSSDGSGTVTGLTHLIGETVRAFDTVNGVDIGSYTVDGSGEIDVGTSNASRTLVVGLHANAEIDGLDISIEDGTGSSEGRYKAFDSATIRLVNTYGGQFYSPATQDWFDIPYDLDDYDKPNGLFTGDKRVDWGAGWDRTQQFKVRQTEAYPMTVAGWVLEGRTSGG